jgi:hypothetical protein
MLLVVLSFLSMSAAKNVTFSNTAPRLDATGSIINAHDGTTRRYGGVGSPFYYHSIGYPHCNETGAINGCNNCIFSRANSIDVWSSLDLSSGSWKKESTVYPNHKAALPSCTYFRSQTVYNAATQQYVLWANAVGCETSTCPNGRCGEYVVATAPAPEGPFAFHSMATPTAPSPTHSLGDFALFVDGDGSGWGAFTYLLKGAGPREVWVISLTPDFTGFGTESTGALPGQRLVEAPAMFKRNSTYYVLLGGCTCMGLYGGGVGVVTAPHPLGPWSNVTGSLDPGCDMWRQPSCFTMGPGAICNPVTQAQQNFVVEVPLADGSSALVWTGKSMRHSSSASAPSPLRRILPLTPHAPPPLPNPPKTVGDRWQQSPNKMYDEQPQTWLPLSFDGDTILPLQWVDNFTLDIV